MSIPAPNFNFPIPSPATHFKDLGAELLAFGLGVDELLAEFDYSGADPNLVLARVVALETWKADIESWREDAAVLLDDLAAERRTTGWVNFLPLIGAGGAWTTASVCQIRRTGKRIEMRGNASRSFAYTTYTAWGALPYGFRPGVVGGYTYLNVGDVGSNTAKNLRITNPGTLASTDPAALDVYAQAASTFWNFEALAWETADDWPTGY